MPASVRMPVSRRLPETMRTLRRLGIRVSGEATLSIVPFPSAKFSQIRGTAPLLVPAASSPTQALALLRRLGTSAPGPFFAAGKAGQINAALFAAACLANQDPKTRRALDRFRSLQTSSVPSKP